MASQQEDPVPVLDEATKAQAFADLKAMWEKEAEAALGVSELPEVNDKAFMRFLTARQFDVTKAYEQIRDYYLWRKKDKIDELPPMGSPSNPYCYGVRGYSGVPDLDPDMSSPNMPPFLKHCGGGCFHKTDRDGNPIVIELIGRYNTKKLAAEVTAEEYVAHHVRLVEFLTTVLMKDSSEKIGSEVEKCLTFEQQTVIFDCTGMGMHQLHMPALAILRALSEHDSKYYPERLGRLFLVNAPGLFTRVWSVIKKWLDKGILDKVHILGSNSSDVLLTHIARENLPISLGGSCKCAHMPNGCVPLFSPGAVQNASEFDYSAQLKDPKDPHCYEITVPMEELVISSSPNLVYKFKTQKKPVQFELRHRKYGASEDTIIVSNSAQESHASVVKGSIPAEPGFYTFTWTKISKGITGINLTSVPLEYSVDIQLADITNTDSSTPTNGGESSDDDEGDFLDAEEE
ncbi:cytosolic factor, phosphatidylinositol/phosphatidylcholine transfer protein [Irineochytrium annulatum]|nr:cytosolic factor, phosphatidylinositol/phosphatidylcholine transfer protein [Irineochytrium annulatum]